MNMPASIADREPLPRAPFCSRSELADQWMKRGIDLLNENSVASLRESILCFDRAIELRHPLPFEENAWFRYGYIAGWMNRADALTRLGTSADLEKALDAYAEAFRHLARLPLGEHPSFRRRLAIAWINRGVTLDKQGTLHSLPEAVRSFEQALAVLAEMSTNDIDLNLPRAGAWLNRGLTLLRMQPARPAGALESAQEAGRLVKALEEQNCEAAGHGLTARHLACRALGHWFASAEAASLPDSWVFTASDAVEEGLNLARHWKFGENHHHRPIIVDLFRFGALVYQRFQPHFLPEFLLDQMDPERCPRTWREDPEVRAIVREALGGAMSSLQSTVFRTVNTPEFSRTLQRVREIREAASHLGFPC